MYNWEALPLNVKAMDYLVANASCILFSGYILLMKNMPGDTFVIVFISLFIIVWGSYF